MAIFLLERVKMLGNTSSITCAFHLSPTKNYLIDYDDTISISGYRISVYGDNEIHYNILVDYDNSISLVVTENCDYDENAGNFKFLLTNSAYSYIILCVTLEVNYAFAVQTSVYGRGFQPAHQHRVGFFTG